MVEAGRVFDKALSFRNSDQMTHNTGVMDFKPVRCPENSPENLLVT